MANTSDRGIDTHCFVKIGNKLIITKRNVFSPCNPGQTKQNRQKQLRDSAFQPNTYTISLEKGISRSPCYTIHPN